MGGGAAEEGEGETSLPGLEGALEALKAASEAERAARASLGDASPRDVRPPPISLSLLRDTPPAEAAHAAAYASAPADTVSDVTSPRTPTSPMRLRYPALSPTGSSPRICRGDDIARPARSPDGATSPAALASPPSKLCAPASAVGRDLSPPPKMASAGYAVDGPPTHAAWASPHNSDPPTPKSREAPTPPSAHRHADHAHAHTSPSGACVPSPSVSSGVSTPPSSPRGAVHVATDLSPPSHGSPAAPWKVGAHLGPCGTEPYREPAAFSPPASPGSHPGSAVRSPASAVTPANSAPSPPSTDTGHVASESAQMPTGAELEASQVIGPSIGPFIAYASRRSYRTRRACPPRWTR